MLKLTIFLIGIFFCGLLTSQAQAAAPSADTYSLTLEWNASPSPEIIGCHLYYGTVSEEYTNTVVVGNVTTVTVDGLSFGVDYYFAITSIDADGEESDFSNEINYQREQAALPDTQLHIQGADDGQFTLTMNGVAGHTYDIEATEDFTTWTIINTVTVDDTGLLNFTDSDAPNYAQRFYRTHDLAPADAQPSSQAPSTTVMQIRGTPDGQFILTINGVAGHTYDIEATEDLMDWTVINTVTLDDSGSLDFTDVDAPDYAQRFYRLREDEP